MHTLYNLLTAAFLILSKDHLWVLVACRNLVKHCRPLLSSSSMLSRDLVSCRTPWSFPVPFAVSLAVRWNLNNVSSTFHRERNSNPLKNSNSCIKKLVSICLYEVRRSSRKVCCMLVAIGESGKWAKDIRKKSDFHLQIFVHFAY